MDSPTLFQAHTATRAVRCHWGRDALAATVPFTSPCLAQLCCHQMGREETPSGTFVSASRPWDVAVAAGTQGQAQLLLTLAATQDTTAGSHGLLWSRSRPTPTCWHQESSPESIPCCSLRGNHSVSVLKSKG